MNLIRALERPDTALDRVLVRPMESSKQDRQRCFEYIVFKMRPTGARAKDWEDLRTPFYLRFERHLSKRVEPINGEQHLIRLSRQMFQNCRIDAERQRSRDSRLESGPLEEEHEKIPEAGLSATDRAATIVLRDCLSQLPETQQTIVRLVDLEGRSQSEVAIGLGLGERRVSRLHKEALEKLKECLTGRKRSKKQ